MANPLARKKGLYATWSQDLQKDLSLSNKVKHSAFSELIPVSILMKAL